MITLPEGTLSGSRTLSTGPINFPPPPEERWNEYWDATCRLLEQTEVRAQMEAWVRPLIWHGANVDSQGLKIELQAPNEFSAQWVRSNYQPSIERALTQILGAPCSTIIDARVLEPLEAQEAIVIKKAALATKTRIERVEIRQNAYDIPDSRYFFDNFVVGTSNQFAYASAVAVAEHPGKQYNPLFLYSPPGLGKTHLLHAIGNRYLQASPSAKVVYVSAERIVNELIDSLQHRRMSQFRQKFRDSFDMILIDDIQFIAGKTTSEEEFFHTFNALYSSKRQIVVTSDRQPKEIAGLEERIRTRFEWGLVADICPPEIETRIAILKTKAERDDIYLPDDVAHFLASTIHSNVRELEGVLIRLQAQASLTGAEISLDMAKHELRSHVLDIRSTHTPETLLAAVAKHYRLRPQDLKMPTRARAISLPRQVAMYLIRKHTGIGLREIGISFGGKDHSTILHACNKIDSLLQHDPVTKQALDSIYALL